MAEDLDGYDGLAPSDAQKDAVLNWGLRQVGLSIYLYGDVAITLTTNDQAIRLDDTTKFASSMLSIDEVLLDEAVLRDQTRRRGLWTVDMFKRWFPSANSAAAGVPVAATILDNKLKFDKPVNNATATGGGTATGRHLPVPISDTNLEPIDVPHYLHEIIVYLAAIKWSLPNATEQEQYMRLKSYSSDAMPLLVAEFRRMFKNTHGRDPDLHILRQACSAYKTTERRADGQSNSSN